MRQFFKQSLRINDFNIVQHYTTLVLYTVSQYTANTDVLCGFLYDNIDNNYAQKPVDNTSLFCWICFVVSKQHTFTKHILLSKWNISGNIKFPFCVSEANCKYIPICYIMTGGVRAHTLFIHTHAISFGHVVMDDIRFIWKSLFQQKTITTHITEAFVVKKNNEWHMSP